MRTFSIGLLLMAITLSGTALAKDDHHECEAALDKLKAVPESRLTDNAHHEFQQAREAHDSGDFKKCSDQAEKALSHLKK